MRNQLFIFSLCCILGLQTAFAKLLFFEYKTKFNGLQKLSYAFSLKNGLTAAEKQAILDMTNALRLKITTGQEKTSAIGLAPNATNMMAVEWDDDLARFAQNWANKCSTGHSNVPLRVQSYKKATVSENLSGGTVRIDLDMYGEVVGWNYVSQTCQSGKQCGHYNTLVSWANFRLGCGYKVCETPGSTVSARLNLVCEFAPYRAAGLMPFGKRRQYQYEYWTNLKPGVSYNGGSSASYMYAKSMPCSDCPQGWDYCMKGGLCATKRQCDTDSGNDCVCNIKQSECEKNGGTFDSSNCRCTCPATRYGRNCAHKCKNLPHVLQCGMTCGNGNVEIFLCYESCGSCGKSVSRAYKYWMEERPAKDANMLKVRATPPNPNPAIDKNVQTASLPDRGKCPNKETDYFCENIRARNYCNDAVNGARWKHYCAASCNTCGNKEWENLLNKMTAAAGMSSSVPAIPGAAKSSGWTSTGSASTSDSGWSNTGSSTKDSGWSNTGSSTKGSGWSNTGSSTKDSGWGDDGSASTSGDSGWKNTAATSDSGWGPTGFEAKAPPSDDGGWTDAGASDGWTNVPSDS